MWLLIGSIALILTIIIMFSPMYISVKYNLHRDGQHSPDGAVDLSSPVTGVQLSLLWGLIKFRLRLSSTSLDFKAFKPVLKMRTKIMGRSDSAVAGDKAQVSLHHAWHMIERVYNFFQSIMPANRYLISKTHLHNFKWVTGLGLPEAHQTGMATGLLWMIKGNVTALLYRLIENPAPRPELAVKPVFGDSLMLSIHLQCAFSLRIGHMVAAGMIAGWSLIKRRFHQPT